MTRKYNRNYFALIILSLSAAHAQSPASSLKWSPKRGAVALAEGDGSLVVSLNTSPATEWILGVRTDNSHAVDLVSARVHFADPSTYPKAHIRPIASVTDVSPGELSFSAGHVAVTTTGANEAILVLLTVPEGTTLTVNKNGQTVLSATPSGSLMLHNGELVPAKISGVRSLVTRLINPTQSEMGDHQEATKFPNGVYVATVPALVAHVSSFTKPVYPANAAPMPAGPPVPVFLRVLIDESGTVKTVSPMQGPTYLSGVCENALKQWAFKPFVDNGKPVRVSGSVVFMFHPGGVVQSPFF